MTDDPPKNPDLVHFAIDPAGVWAYSRFPSPFVTADYDAEDRIIGLSAAAGISNRSISPS